MGRHWGQIAYSRGMIRYALSQHEQNAMYGFFKKGGPNLAKRVYSQIFKIAPSKYRPHSLSRAVHKTTDPQILLNSAVKFN